MRKLTFVMFLTFFITLTSLAQVMFEQIQPKFSELDSLSKTYLYCGVVMKDKIYGVGGGYNFAGCLGEAYFADGLLGTAVGYSFPCKWFSLSLATTFDLSDDQHNPEINYQIGLETLINNFNYVSLKYNKNGLIKIDYGHPVKVND